MFGEYYHQSAFLNCYLIGKCDFSGTAESLKLDKIIEKASETVVWGNCGKIVPCTTRQHRLRINFLGWNFSGEMCKAQLKTSWSKILQQVVCLLYQKKQFPQKFNLHVPSYLSSALRCRMATNWRIKLPRPMLTYTAHACLLFMIMTFSWHYLWIMANRLWRFWITF